MYVNCTHCDKKYKTKGWLSNHMSRNHKDALLLEQENTMILMNAHDLSCQEAMLNLSDNPIWEGLDPWGEDQTEATPKPSEIPTSTPSANLNVPLCSKASENIVQKEKTLPASFLANLLPPPAFLEELDRSLQDNGQVEDLLQRFEREIRYFKCQLCEFNCSGNTNLKKHMDNNHPQGMPSSPDPALTSLGEYLASLESKLERCTDLILKQSAQSSQQTELIKKLLARQETRPHDIHDIIQFFKCKYCQFETEKKKRIGQSQE